jgi:PIN domain nuclease of toxin-antitoxin system
MVLLLDTHVLLWTLDAPQRLPEDVAAQIEAPETTVYPRLSISHFS